MIHIFYFGRLIILSMHCRILLGVSVLTFEVIYADTTLSIYRTDGFICL